MSDKTWQSWVWVKWRPGTPSDAWEKWKGDPLVKSAWSTLGHWDCVLCLNTQDPDEVEKFVWKHLRRNEWVESTSTTFAKKWW
jgi:DNA-binding Lrp family transcriptional regulator